MKKAWVVSMERWPLSISRWCAPGAVVPHDEVAADLDEIARALAVSDGAGVPVPSRVIVSGRRAGGGTDGARSWAAVEGTAAVDAATVAMKSLRFTTSLP